MHHLYYSYVLIQLLRTKMNQILNNIYKIIFHRTVIIFTVIIFKSNNLE